MYVILGYWVQLNLLSPTAMEVEGTRDQELTTENVNVNDK